MRNSEINQAQQAVVQLQALSPVLFGENQFVSFQDYQNNLTLIQNVLNSIIQNNSKSAYKVNMPVFSTQQPTNGQTWKYNSTLGMWVPS